ncbi:Y-family DNA polymerase [Larkinella knui]|uniref:Y-family DNA polymerase n=1 Tax=Larkinella knui TaxID=2025310 RepID=A0A3P1CPI1_9BACT|nr:Y-family DNA polymerase [Larkinella knui]RRB15232.1 Y-family DNA polymerase [Larkinella knui]
MTEEIWKVHVDVNNFYPSCHVSVNPALKDKAVAVLSNNDGNVISRSVAAKAMGIPMGAVFHEIKHLVTAGKLIVFSSKYQLYGDFSTRVMNILRRFFSAVELYSIDEAFAEFKGTLREVIALARKVKNIIFRWLRLPVSVGIALTKSLAKTATYVAKRREEHDGVFAFGEPEQTHEVLKKMKVGDLWGIGYSGEKKLHGIGVENALQFTQLPDGWIQKNLTVQGLRLAYELRGEVCRPLQLEIKPKKAIMVAPSFGRIVTDLETMTKALKRHITKAGEKLRHQHSKAALMTVFINTNRYAKHKPQYSNSLTFSLPFATNENEVLFRCAASVLSHLYTPGYDYHKVGVMLSGLSPDTSQQLKLFVESPDPRRSRLEKVFDRIRLKYGRDLVFYADRMPINEPPPDWLTRQQYPSEAPTTSWKEILKAA